MPLSPDASVAVPVVSSSPLVHLLADVLSRTAGYQMTPAFALLLSDDPLLLAALQRLAFARLSEERKEGNSCPCQ